MPLRVVAVFTLVSSRRTLQKRKKCFRIEKKPPATVKEMMTKGFGGFSRSSPDIRKQNRFDTENAIMLDLFSYSRAKTVQTKIN